MRIVRAASRSRLTLAVCKVGLDRPLIPTAFVANLVRSARISRPRRSADRGSPGNAPMVGDWETCGRGGRAGQEALPEPVFEVPGSSRVAAADRTSISSTRGSFRTPAPARLSYSSTSIRYKISPEWGGSPGSEPVIVDMNLTPARVWLLTAYRYSWRNGAGIFEWQLAIVRQVISERKPNHDKSPRQMNG